MSEEEYEEGYEELKSIKEHITADEMFKELGFEKSKNAKTLFYTQKIKAPNYTERTIVISDFSKTFEGIFTQTNIGGKGTEHFPLCMTMQELKAINKKVEELGWNE